MRIRDKHPGFATLLDAFIFALSSINVFFVISPLSWPSAETRSWIPWSKPPLPAVASSPTSTSLSSARRARVPFRPRRHRGPSSSHPSYLVYHVHVKLFFFWSSSVSCLSVCEKIMCNQFFIRLFCTSYIYSWIFGDVLYWSSFWATKFIYCHSSFCEPSR